MVLTYHNKEFWLKSTRLIIPGEELFWDYGDCLPSSLKSRPWLNYGRTSSPRVRKHGKGLTEDYTIRGDQSGHTTSGESKRPFVDSKHPGGSRLVDNKSSEDVDDHKSDSGHGVEGL